MESNGTPYSFWIPLDLEKSLDDEERRICGIISTEDVDLDGEIIRENLADYSPMLMQMGKNLSAALADKIDWDRFSTRSGFLKWEHGEEPGNIIGIPERIEKSVIYKDPVTNTTKSGTAIWGKLFGPDAGIQKANEAWALIQAIKKSGFKRPLGYSIEGAYVPIQNLPPTEKACMVTSVVLTQKPVNSFAWADMAKALTAGGGGTDSAQMAGGAALRRQSHHGFTCNHVDENGKLKSHRDALEHAVKCMGKDIDTAKKAVVLAYRRAA